MKRQTRTDLAMSAAVVFLGASLVFSGRSLLRLHWRTGGPAMELGLQELLGVGAAGAGIALLCWWLLALVCAFISAIAHARGAGRVAAISGSFAPAFMRRVVIAVLGMNLLAVPLANAAEGPGVDPLWHADTVVVSVAGTSGQDPLPPESHEAVVPHWVPQTAQTAPDLLMRPGSRDDHSPAMVEDVTEMPASDIPTNAGTPVDEEHDVVVKKGDTLWSIVAAALGPYASDVDVAQSWPDWYRTNRATIGADPNSIFPGQVLHAP